MTSNESETQLRKIVRAVYVLCGISVIGLIVSVWLNIHLTNLSISEVKELSVGSSEQQLINELNSLLESTQLDILIERCNKEVAEKPLSRTAYFYLGLAYYHSGKKAESKKHLIKALEIDPSWTQSIQPYLDKLE